MEIKPIEIYSDAPNSAIVRVPGRQFPGSVIQGDSLSILLANAQTIMERVKDSEDEELVYTAQELTELLRARLSHYERVLAEHNIPLPYTK